MQAAAPPRVMPPTAIKLWDAAVVEQAPGAGYGLDPGQDPRLAVQLPIYGVPPSTLVPAVSATLLQLEQGSFWAAAYLADGMMRDDQIFATLQVREAGLLGRPRHIEAAIDGDAFCKQVEGVYNRAVPDPQLGLLMRYGWLLSVGIAQRVYDNRFGKMTPTIHTWNPRYLRYDWLLRRYRLVTENRGEITIEPGDPEWIVYEPYGPLGWIHGALIRPLALPWLIRYWVRNWWARYAEVHGQPIRKAIIPPDRRPDDERKFLSDLQRIGHEAVVRLQQGKEGNHFDLQLLEASSNSWQGFQALLEHEDDAIAKLVLGQSQSTKGQGGLGSTEKPGDAVRIDIARQDAHVTDCVREQFLCPWAMAETGDPDKAPKVCYDVDPPEDLLNKAKHLALLGDALAKLVPYGADSLDLLKSFKVKMRDGAVAVEQVPVSSSIIGPPASLEDKVTE